MLSVKDRNMELKQLCSLAYWISGKQSSSRMVEVKKLDYSKPRTSSSLRCPTLICCSASRQHPLSQRGPPQNSMIAEQQHINEKRGILMASSGIWVTGPGFPRENLLHNTQRTQKRLWDGTGAALSPTQTARQWIRLSAINEVSLARTVHPTVAAVTLRFFFHREVRGHVF